MTRWSVMFVVCCALAGCGDGSSGGPDAAMLDTDGDGLLDAVDNCPTVGNADQSDQDADDEGDACDCTNNNAAVVAANADSDDNKRDPNNRICAEDRTLTGVVIGLGVGGYVDTFAPQCTARCDATDTTEDFGEQPDQRGLELTCPAGQVIVGVAYKDVDGTTPPDDRVDSLTVLCAPTGGPDFPATPAANPDLAANPNALITATCPDGSTAAGLVDVDSPTASGNSDALESVTILCRDGRW